MNFMLSTRAPRRRRAGVVAAAVLALLGVMGSGSAWAAEPAVGPASASGDHCVLDATTNAYACYPTLTESIRNATDGRVTDAPQTGAEIDQAVRDAINDAGDQADAAGGTSRRIMTIVYTGTNFAGASMTITGSMQTNWPGGRVCTSQSGPLVTFPAGFAGKVKSFQSFGSCLPTTLTVEPWEYFAWYGNDQLADVSPYVRQPITHFRYRGGPSRIDLLRECGTATITCTFTPASRPVGGQLAWEDINILYNCTDIVQSDTLIWTDEAASSITAGVEVTVSAGAEVGFEGAKASFGVSVTARYDMQWVWSQSFTRESPVRAPKQKMAVLYYIQRSFGSGSPRRR